jgi:hypothetical protein
MAYSKIAAAIAKINDRMRSHRRRSERALEKQSTPLPDARRGREWTLTAAHRGIE